jgi:microcystin-dependent protein
MSDPFIGEIRLFTGNFAPFGWAFCNGQMLSISQNTALFAVIGTIYGGDGKTNFALPDLQGRIPMQFGQGPGLSNRDLGASFGAETATLTANQMPAHSHSATIKGANTGTTNQPQDNLFGKILRSNMYSTPDAALSNMAEGSIPLQNAGGSLAHNNMQPYLTMNFIIAIIGLFPVRS